MNDELQGKLVEILTSIQRAAGATGDFAIEQLPDIVQQYIAYGRFIHTFAFALGVIGLIFMAVFIYKLWGRMEEVWPAFIAVFGGGVFLLLASVNLPQVGLVWFAPKVWLLREIVFLLK